MKQRAMKMIMTVLLVAMVASTAVAKKKQQVIAPSYAWTIGEPLGLHYASTLDTLHFNYHKGFVPSMHSNVWATTGNYGAEAQNQVFFQRPATSDFFFEDAMQAWIPSVTTQRYYNTRIPMTVLAHSTGGDKHSNQDHTQALFSGNVDKRIEVGGALDYIYSKGAYDFQADKNFRWSLFGSYMGDRYEMQAFFNHYSITAKESGGIVDDRYITDPAAVQGGETKVSAKDISTRLTAAQTKLSGKEFYMNHRYKVGYYHYERDSITDTIKGKTYIPVTSFIWTMDYKDGRHNFLNKSGAQDTSFFKHTYLGLGGTDETTSYHRLRNTVGVSLLEGFNRYAKFGFSLYGTHELRGYTQATDSVTGTTPPKGLEKLPVAVDHSHTEHVAWVGGQLTKQHGSILTYDATAQFGVLGDVVGDIDVKGEVSTKMRLLGDTVTLQGYGYFKNLEAPYLLKHFVSNHYAWSNDLAKEKRLRVGGVLNVPFTGSNVNVGYETLKNYIYFGTEGTPQQHSAPIHVLNATLKQQLQFKALHWDNEVTYQATSNSHILPLPKLSVYSNLYFTFTVARVLHVQLGIDGNYYTSYHAPAFNPATMSFNNQSAVKCGDFAMMNLYANFKMKQARFFVMYSHFNKGLFGGNHYFAVPHYPLNPSRLQFGVSVNFLN